MNKIFKKIALPVLIALLSIVLCIFGNMFVRNDNSQIAEATSGATDATATITADKTELVPGEEVTFTITIHSNIEGMWEGVLFVLGEVDADNKPIADHMQYFSLVNYSCSLDYDFDATHYWTTHKQLSKVGVYFQFVDSGHKTNTTSDVVVTCTLKLNEDFTDANVGNINFGINYSSINYVMISQSDAINSTYVLFRDMTKNTVGISVGN